MSLSSGSLFTGKALNVDFAVGAIVGTNGLQRDASSNLMITFAPPYPINWQNGLPLSIDGELYVVPYYNITAPTYNVNGLTFDSTGGIVVTDITNAVLPYQESNGLVFDANGALIVSSIAGTVFLKPSTWTARPNPASVPIGSILPVTDIGFGGRSYWWNDGTNWNSTGDVFLYLSNTQVLGVNGQSGVAQKLGLSIAIPRSVLASLRYFEIFALWSKSGTTDAASNISIYLGPSGTSSDSSILSTSVFSASNRQASTSSTMRYNSSLGKAHIANVSQNNALTTGSTSTTAYPDKLTAVLSDVDQFISLYLTMGGNTDTPALESFWIIGH